MEDIRVKQKKFLNLWLQKGLSQKQIAETIGITQATVCKWVAIIKDEYHLLYNTRLELIQKIRLTLASTESNSTDVHNYTTALSVISKQFKELPTFLLFKLNN